MKPALLAKALRVMISGAALVGCWGYYGGYVDGDFSDWADDCARVGMIYGIVAGPWLALLYVAGLDYLTPKIAKYIPRYARPVVIIVHLSVVGSFCSRTLMGYLNYQRYHASGATRHQVGLHP